MTALYGPRGRPQVRGAAHKGARLGRQACHAPPRRSMPAQPPEQPHEIRAFLAYLEQAGHEPAPALRAVVARTRTVRRARLRLFVLRRASFPPRRKLDVVAQPLRGRRRRPHQAHARRADGLHRAALPSAAAGRGDRDRRPDAGRAHGARPGAGHQPGLFQAVRPRLQFPQIADAGIRRLPARGLWRPAAVLIPRRDPQDRVGGNLGAAVSAAASAALDDEPRSADAGILRQERHQSRLFPGLSARRCRAALPRFSRRLEKGRLAAQAEHRLLHHHLCGRKRRQGARRRAQARRARL